AGDFSTSAAEECTVGLFELLHADLFFSHGDVEFLADRHHCRACDPGENVTDRGSVWHASDLNKDVRARRLRATTVQLEHERSVVAPGPRVARCKYSTHIVAAYLGFHPDRLRVGTLIRRHTKTHRLIAEVLAPFPRTDHDVRLGRLRQIHVCAGVYQGPYVGVGEPVTAQHLIACLDQLF